MGIKVRGEFKETDFEAETGDFPKIMTTRY